MSAFSNRGILDWRCTCSAIQHTCTYLLPSLSDGLPVSFGHSPSPAVYMKTSLSHRPEVDPDRSEKPPAQYALVRSMSDDLRDMNKWAGPRQRPTQLPHSPFAMQKVNVQPGDTLAFQDFAGILMTNTASIADLNRRMGTTTYPVNSFRSNIVVKAKSAWEEEDWLTFKMANHSFRKIKECARCTVPGRDQTTGEYHFKGGSYDGVKGKLLTAQSTLVKVSTRTLAPSLSRTRTYPPHPPHPFLFLPPSLALCVCLGMSVLFGAQLPSYPSSNAQHDLSKVLFSLSPARCPLATISSTKVRPSYV
jgi:hypothetical protein